MNKFFSIVFVLLFGLWSNLGAQDKLLKPNMYLSPVITIGYTMGAGLNYGFELDVGVFQLPNSLMDVDFGVSFEYYFVNNDTEVHSIRTMNIMLENDFIHARIGSGMVKKKWGIKKINSASVMGLNYGISISEASASSPWLGFKQLYLGKERWEWFSRDNYLSFYMYFRQEKVQIIAAE